MPRFKLFQILFYSFFYCRIYGSDNIAAVRNQITVGRQCQISSCPLISDGNCYYVFTAEKVLRTAIRFKCRLFRRNPHNIFIRHCAAPFYFYFTGLRVFRQACSHHIPLLHFENPAWKNRISYKIHSFQEWFLQTSSRTAASADKGR